MIRATAMPASVSGTTIFAMRDDEFVPARWPCEWREELRKQCCANLACDHGGFVKSYPEDRRARRA